MRWRCLWAPTQTLQLTDQERLQIERTSHQRVRACASSIRKVSSWVLDVFAWQHDGHSQNCVVDAPRDLAREISLSGTCGIRVRAATDRRGPPPRAGTSARVCYSQ